MNNLNSIFKIERGKVEITSDNIYIKFKNKDEIEIDRKNLSDDDLIKIKKILKNKEIEISFSLELFKIFIVKKEEIKEYISIEAYKREVISIELDEDIEEYISKEFENEDNYEIYFIDRKVLEDIINFCLKNKIRVVDVYFNEKKDYKIDDYKIKDFKNKKINRFIQVIILMVIILSIGINIYKTKVCKELNVLRETYNISIDKLSDIKSELENIKKKNKELDKKIEISKLEKKNPIKYIFNILPENLFVDKIFIEKNKIEIKGYCEEKRIFFNFLDKLSKDENIKKLNYDYLTRKEINYEFLLEIEVHIIE